MSGLSLRQSCGELRISDALNVDQMRMTLGSSSQGKVLGHTAVQGMADLLASGVL